MKTREYIRKVCYYNVIKLIIIPGKTRYTIQILNQIKGFIKPNIIEVIEYGKHEMKVRNEYMLFLSCIDDEMYPKPLYRCYLKEEWQMLTYNIGGEIHDSKGENC
jgi:hypothetical protein